MRKRRKRYKIKIKPKKGYRLKWIGASESGGGWPVYVKSRRRYSSNPLRGMPSWMTPVLLIGGAILVVHLISKGTKAAISAATPVEQVPLLAEK